MCGRFTLHDPSKILAETFSLRDTPAYPSRFNVAPSQEIAIIRQNAAGENTLDFLRWGLVPHWAKDKAIGYKMINARSETVHEKPAFRHAIRYNRCIIPASGFYDWQHIGAKKQPYYFHMADNSPMAFAGLWEQWKDPGAENPLETFTILTTVANELVAPVHDRMPVILHPDNYGLWLNRDIHDPEQLRHLYRPFPTDLMSMYQVPDLVNNPKFDSPACIARV